MVSQWQRAAWSSPATLQSLAPGRVRGDLDLWHGVTPPLGLADLRHRQFALRLVEPVDEQHPVQVVGLMLYAAGQLARPLQRDRLPVHVEALRDHAVGTGRRVDQTGEGQAAFVV